MRPALWLLLAGCLSKPDRPDEPGSELCGNAVLDEGERCDDGNARPSDGCSDRCEIEAWFVCPTEGELCHPVLELQWTEPGRVLTGIGGLGGGDFEDDCKDIVGLSVRNTVIVGVEGGADPDGTSLTGMRVICADIVELRRDGGLRWGNPMPTARHGNDASTGLAVQMCDDDEVATGLGGTAGGVVSGFQLACQALTHLDGKLALGTANRLPPVGPNNQALQSPQTCGPLEVARSVVGKSGAVIDHASLRCVPTALVVCGDGIVTEPETCDDGNAVGGDGCNETCNGD